MTKKRGKRGYGEGSIYERADGRWEAALSIEGGRRRSFYAKTRREVATKLRQALDEKDKNLPIVNKRRTVASHLTDWIAAKKSSPGKASVPTIQGYEQIVRLHLIPAIGSIKLHQLLSEHIEAMMDHGIADGRSPQSVNHDRAVLTTALNYAIKKNRLAINVASLSEKRGVPEQKVRALTPQRAREVLEAVKNDRLRAMYSIEVVVGLRQSEALGLQWTDLDEDTGSLYIQRSLKRYNGAFHFDPPKTEKSQRTVHLYDELIKELRQHRARQAEERLRAGPAWEGEAWGGLIFANELGAPLHGTTISKKFPNLVAEAGIPPMKYHHLRYGAASLMAAQGHSPRTAMEILGHARISTTLGIYTRVTTEAQRDAVNSVGEAIWGAS